MASKISIEDVNLSKAMSLAKKMAAKHLEEFA